MHGKSSLQNNDGQSPDDDKVDAMLYHNNALAILPACESLSQASTCTQHLRIGQVGGPLTE
jgi:hypothetical protein